MSLAQPQSLHWTRGLTTKVKGNHFLWTLPSVHRPLLDFICSCGEIFSPLWDKIWERPGNAATHSYQEFIRKLFRAVEEVPACLSARERSARWWSWVGLSRTINFNSNLPQYIVCPRTCSSANLHSEDPGFSSGWISISFTLPSSVPILIEELNQKGTRKVVDPMDMKDLLMDVLL